MALLAECRRLRRLDAPIINDATITASGGTSGTARTLTLNGGLTNNGTIAVQTYNTFDNSSGNNLQLGPGSVSMQGGTLAGSSYAYSASNFKGYGTVSAALTNTGSVYANNASNALIFTGAVTNTRGHMYASDGVTNGTLELNNDVTGGTISPNGGIIRLNNAASQLIGPMTIDAGTVNVTTAATNTALFSGTLTTAATINIASGHTANANNTAIFNNSGIIYVGTDSRICHGPEKQ